MIRLFAGLPVPDDIAYRLEPLQKGVDGARWRDRSHFHVTLGFFGEMSEPLAEELDVEIGELYGRGRALLEGGCESLALLPTPWGASVGSR
ncbi:2'-5' RNA ligase family protein, partial [Henriciella sp.]|uniref:2'-5' RNA ligase family protein n=1 Tax=Henriciella sp. TaxID=1968823 RepID=UPI001821E738